MALETEAWGSGPERAWVRPKVPCHIMQLGRGLGSVSRVLKVLLDSG